MPRHWTPNEIQNLKEAYFVEKLPLRLLHTVVKTRSHSACVSKLQKLRWVERKTFWSKKAKEQMVELYHQGYSCKEIAERVDHPTQLVIQLICKNTDHRQTAKGNKPFEWTPEKVQFLKWLLERGKLRKEMCEAFNTSRYNVNKGLALCNS